MIDLNEMTIDIVDFPTISRLMKRADCPIFAATMMPDGKTTLESNVPDREVLLYIILHKNHIFQKKMLR